MSGDLPPTPHHFFLTLSLRIPVLVLPSPRPPFFTLLLLSSVWHWQWLGPMVKVAGRGAQREARALCTPPQPWFLAGGLLRFAFPEAVSAGHSRHHAVSTDGASTPEAQPASPELASPMPSPGLWSGLLAGDPWDTESERAGPEAGGLGI